MREKAQQDRQIIAGVYSLNRDDLANIYDQYSEAIYRYAYRLLGDVNLAEDCVSETFRRLLEAMNIAFDVENVKAYLFRIAHNWIIDQYRHRSEDNVSLPENISMGEHQNPEKLIDKKIESEYVRNTLRRLPIEQQQVILLRFFEGCSHEEVAAMLGKTEEATRALQYRALLTLKTLLFQEKEGEPND